MPKPYGEWRYVPRDFYRIDDRTGFKVRNSRQIKEWEGLWVGTDIWEQRHPQDFVRGTVDDQNVHEQLRPRTQDIFISVIAATPVNGYVAEDDTTFYVAEDGVTFYVQEN